MKQFRDDEEQEPTNTIWVNDTKYTATFRLMQFKHGKAPNSASFKKYVIAPGETKLIDSQFDSAIRTEDKYGRVIGGLCPWLKKQGEDEVEMEDCLNFEAVADKMAIQKLAEELKQSKALEEAIKVHAEQKVAEAADPKPKRGRKSV